MPMNLYFTQNHRSIGNIDNTHNMIIHFIDLRKNYIPPHQTSLDPRITMGTTHSRYHNLSLSFDKDRLLDAINTNVKNGRYLYDFNYLTSQYAGVDILFERGTIVRILDETEVFILYNIRNLLAKMAGFTNHRSNIKIDWLDYAYLMMVKY